ncbi:MAG: single-stranded DNA-binding protein [Deltaproteobacteria bacterium]|nr:single-stranded DNA-binding protein [Deltaproteobacteria bacterium]
MADGLNKVLLIGNLGADPELSYTQSSQAILKLRLATNESFTNKAGERQERTEWHRIVIWGKRAEALGKFLTKGKQLYVEGRMQTRSWEDKEGQKRYTTEVVATEIILLGGGAGRSAGASSGAADGGGGGSGFGGGGGGRERYSDVGPEPVEPYGAPDPGSNGGKIEGEDDIPF